MAAQPQQADDVEQRLDRLEATLEEERECRHDLEGRVEDLEEENQELRDDLAAYREQNEKGKADIRRWVATWKTHSASARHPGTRRTRIPPGLSS